MKGLVGRAVMVMMAFSGPPAVLEARSAEARPSMNLKNGAPLLVSEEPSLPRVTVQVTFAGGPALVPVELQGLALVASAIVSEGPSSMGEGEYRRTLFLTNAEIQIESERQAMRVTVQAPPDHLRDALELTRSALLSPRLEQRTFARAKERVLADTALRDDDMEKFVSYFAPRDVFAYAAAVLDGQGTRTSVSRVTLAKVEELLPRLFDLSRASFAAVGAVPSLRLRELIETVFISREPQTARYQHQTIPQPDVQKALPDELRIVVIDRPGAAENQIHFRYPDVLREDRREWAVAQVAHRLLGGGVAGRLGEELRSKRGLTYHAGTYLEDGVPLWTAWTFGNVENTPALMRGVQEVIATFKATRPTAAEVRQAAARCLTEFMTIQELPQDRLEQRIRLRMRGLDDGYLDRHAAALRSVTVADVRRFAKRHLRIAGGYLYLMGDKRNLLPSVAKVFPDARPPRVIAVDDIP